MGKRSGRQMIFSWTRTVDALIAEGAEVTARCSRCNTNTPVDLEAVRRSRGGLYSFWNRHPRCPAEGCDDNLVYIAARPDAGVWPTRMTNGDPIEVDFINADWRASQLGAELGGMLGVQVMLAMVQTLTRYGLFTRQERSQLVDRAVRALPRERQEDGRWLLEHHIAREDPPPDGWR